MADIVFPEVPFTYEIKGVNFENGTIHVRYLPNNQQYTAVEYLVPILPTFNANDMQTYLKNWAPFDKWFAQQTILDNQTVLQPSA